MARLINRSFRTICTFAPFLTASFVMSEPVVLCNKVDLELYVASFWVDGGLSCGFSGKGCVTHSSGWWVINPGKCFEPPIGMWYDAKLVISFNSPEGEKLFGKFKVDEGVLSGRKFRGISGMRDRYVCISWDSFSRIFSGKFGAETEVDCPPDFEKAPLSLYVRSSELGREILNIR